MKQVSALLSEGEIHTRMSLMEFFNTTDTTLQSTGIYQPKDSLGNRMDSILLFINEKSDHQDSSYKNFVSGNYLIWTGQRKGRKDHQIIEHESNGMELLVFFRKDKFEFDKYGYRYLGRYKYVSHKKQPDGPNLFFLERTDPWNLEQRGLIVPDVEIQKAFGGKDTPNSNVDEFLQTELGYILGKYRPAQTKFSNDVKNLDNFACVVSGNSYRDNLEAGHVKDVRFKGSFTINNGLTFTKNIHAAFDKGHLLINPDSLRLELNYQFPQSSEIFDLKEKTISAAERIDPSFLKFKYERGKAEV